MDLEDEIAHTQAKMVWLSHQIHSYAQELCKLTTQRMELYDRSMELNRQVAMRGAVEHRPPNRPSSN